MSDHVPFVLAVILAVLFVFMQLVLQLNVSSLRADQ